MKSCGNNALLLCYEQQRQQLAFLYLKSSLQNDIELSVANKKERANISGLHFNCTTNCVTVLSHFTAGAQSPISYLGHGTELVQ